VLLLASPLLAHGWEQGRNDGVAREQAPQRSAGRRRAAERLAGRD
jgi:hypothetical protein